MDLSKAALVLILVCMCVCVCVTVHIYMCACVCIRVYVCVCVCVCTYPFSVAMLYALFADAQCLSVCQCCVAQAVVSATTEAQHTNTRAHTRKDAHAHLTSIPRACAPGYNDFPFCNTSLSIDDRVKNLISLLKLTEKPPLLTARESPLGNVSRIGLPGVCVCMYVCMYVCLCVCVCVYVIYMYVYVSVVLLYSFKCYFATPTYTRTLHTTINNENCQNQTPQHNQTNTHANLCE